ncbi:Dim1 family [Dillenia turbinata]|uniref:Dim1 family n=1 Tax=Dillenia turbinata TaxID=194707 RepID=A0AAN8W6M0_9MAGN
MSYLLPHLHLRWAVDQAILAEEEHLVMDEVLASVAEAIKNFAVIYLVDITEVPDSNTTQGCNFSVVTVSDHHEPLRRRVIVVGASRQSSIVFASTLSSIAFIHELQFNSSLHSSPSLLFRRRILTLSLPF